VAQHSMFMSLHDLALLGLKELQSRHPDLVFSTTVQPRHDEDGNLVGLWFDVHDRRFENNEEQSLYYNFKQTVRTILDPNIPEEKLLTMFFELKRAAKDTGGFK
jgi:hypothetical protein